MGIQRQSRTAGAACLLRASAYLRRWKNESSPKLSLLKLPPAPNSEAFNRETTLHLGGGGNRKKKWGSPNAREKTTESREKHTHPTHRHTRSRVMARGLAFHETAITGFGVSQCLLKNWPVSKQK